MTWNMCVTAETFLIKFGKHKILDSNFPCDLTRWRAICQVHFTGSLIISQATQVNYYCHRAGNESISTT